MIDICDVQRLECVCVFYISRPVILCNVTQLILRLISPRKNESVALYLMDSSLSVRYMRQVNVAVRWRLDGSGKQKFKDHQTLNLTIRNI